MTPSIFFFLSYTTQTQRQDAAASDPAQDARSLTSVSIGGRRLTALSFLSSPSNFPLLLGSCTVPYSTTAVLFTPGAFTFTVSERCQLPVDLT